MIRLLLLGLCLMLCGCSLGRVFQTKVPPPVSKAPTQVEAERVAADLIARKIETPVELRPVAATLSTSLGAPQKPILDLPVAEASVKADAGLREGIVDLQRRLDDSNKKLSALQGKEIEGTGFSLLGPGMATIVIGLIAFGVIFPPAFTIIGIMYRRLKQTASMVVEQVDEMAKSDETRAAAQKLKAALAVKMDSAHKQIVSNLQKL